MQSKLVNHHQFCKSGTTARGGERGTVLIFPQERVVRKPSRSRRVDEIEARILDHLQILRRHTSDETVAAILTLRDEIWRIEADEAVALQSAEPGY